MSVEARAYLEDEHRPQPAGDAKKSSDTKRQGGVGWGTRGGNALASEPVSMKHGNTRNANGLVNIPSQIPGYGTLFSEPGFSNRVAEASGMVPSTGLQRRRITTPQSVRTTPDHSNPMAQSACGWTTWSL